LELNLFGYEDKGWKTSKWQLEASVNSIIKNCGMITALKDNYFSSGANIVE